MSARGVLRVIEGGSFGFWCPGCKQMHVVNSGWEFNGNYERPTFRPSILVTGGHYLSNYVPGKPCWCTYNDEHPDDPYKFHCERCHSYVTDGRIEFLKDSSHDLAGQTVELEPSPICG